MSTLEELARAVGIQVEWDDASGEPKRVSSETLVKVLAALGYPAVGPEEIARSLSRRHEEDATLAFVSGDSGKALTLPDAFAGSRAEITLESGETLVRDVDDAGTLAALEQTGYHRLRANGREIILAIAPERCFGVDDVVPDKRMWGPAVQVPSLRASDDGPFGDFATLAESARAFAQRGADVMAISPVHALFPADAGHYSPYGPSSRQFLNVLFARPNSSSSAPSGELIDWAQAIPQRIADLQAEFAGRGREVEAAFSTWRAEQGDELELQATFDALHAHFIRQQAYGWRDWPEEFHDPHGVAVRRFAAEHPEDVGFYAFAQWRAVHGLEAAQAAAREGGMAIGLIDDLAVGLDPGGAQAWSGGAELLQGLSVGAPPDLLGPQGQDWGLTSFSPVGLRRSGFAGFIAMVRAALRHAGGLRIDHILGLNRLWVIPHGSPSSGGAYLTYPLDDLLRILAIESHRARGVVIGEDLGTVPEGLRPRLRARGISGMRVLWFERDGEGNYIPPREWDESAVAMTGTHDTFTAAGWWSGRDIDWRLKLARNAPDSDEKQERAERARERQTLWQALSAEGSAQGDPPDADTPGPVVDAACRHVASTPCRIAIIPMEDIAGLPEQPNLPGTIDEHPNWRRRMPRPTPELLDQPDVSARLAAIAKARS